MDSALIHRVRRTFTEHFGPPAPRVASAPGRVNLIGEHTDYNEGFVFPMAITRGVAIAFRPRDDRRLRGHATAFGETGEAPLDGLAPGSATGWLGYVAGVAWVLEATGARLPGLDFVIDADLPVGAGLSSSAALEVAAARALAEAAHLAWDPVPMAAHCRRAENEFVGVPCGIMDQFASAASRQGCATMLDCRTLKTDPVPLPNDTVVAIMDTGVRRTLASSAYQDRREACEAAVAVLRDAFPGVRALRDVNDDMLDEVRSRLGPLVYRRARHVVEENPRPQALATALRAGDLPAAGRLMDDSHTSLRDLYEVSSAELDRVTAQARAHPACFGARMTGAGFGGCAVALVRKDGADAFLAAVRSAYGGSTSPGDAWFVTSPAQGAGLEAA